MSVRSRKRTLRPMTARSPDCLRSCIDPRPVRRSAPILQCKPPRPMNDTINSPPAEPPSVLGAPSPVLSPTAAPTTLLSPPASIHSSTARPPSEVRPEELSSVLGKIRVLTAGEEEIYRKCEAIVREGWEKWFQAGLALGQIHDNELYRAEFNSFADYCQKRWGIHRSRAYGLIDAAKLAQVLANDTNLPGPDHESSLRPLVPLSREQAKLVWQCAAANSLGRPITLRLIRSTMKTLEIQPKKHAPERVRINKSEQRNVVRDVLQELIVLITAKAAHSDLLQKAELLH